MSWCPAADLSRGITLVSSKPLSTSRSASKSITAFRDRKVWMDRRMGPLPRSRACTWRSPGFWLAVNPKLAVETQRSCDELPKPNRGRLFTSTPFKRWSPCLEAFRSITAWIASTLPKVRVAPPSMTAHPARTASWVLRASELAAIAVIADSSVKQTKGASSTTLAWPVSGLVLSGHSEVRWAFPQRRHTGSPAARGACVWGGPWPLL